MGETYCGKTCDNCTWKEALNCPGCKSGPGSLYSRDCSIAKCCREKGHDSCDSCNLKADCISLRGRYEKPKQRMESLEAEQQRAKEIDERARTIGKWIWILFLLNIPNIIASILTNERMMANMPRLYLFGQVLSIVVEFAYATVLLKLSSAHENYKRAGICRLIVVGGSLLIILIWGGTGATVGPVLTGLMFAIVSVYATYCEYMAHSAVLTGIDDYQADRWELLWKWYMGIYIGIIVSTILVLLQSVLGLLLILGAGIAAIVISIIALIYLYRTAVVFRDYNV